MICAVINRLPRFARNDSITVMSSRGVGRRGDLLRRLAYE